MFCLFDRLCFFVAQCFYKNDMISFEFFFASLVLLHQGKIFWQNATPEGVDKIRQNPKKREEIRYFYCLALKNREEIKMWVGGNI